MLNLLLTSCRRCPLYVIRSSFGVVTETVRDTSINRKLLVPVSDKLTPVTLYCTSAPSGDGRTHNADGQKPGIFRRFHQTYKQHGKILIAVHILTSSVWAGTFYCVAASGIDVAEMLRWVGATEKIVAPFTKSGVGPAAAAYLLYKIATPLRYTVTIAGTHLSVRLLRRAGYLPAIAADDRIRSIVKTTIATVNERRRVRRRVRRQ